MRSLRLLSTLLLAGCTAAGEPLGAAPAIAADAAADEPRVDASSDAGDAGDDVSDARHEKVAVPPICADSGGDGGDTCLAGTAETGSCACGTGTRQRLCEAGGHWGAWNACTATSGLCEPCDRETIACGNCGTRDNVCDPVTCTWIFGVCNGSGPCAPGDFTADPSGCDGGAVQVTACDSTCTWGPPGVCGEPPGWDALPAAPLSAVSQATATSTGTQVLFWGGQDAQLARVRTGARYDVAAGAWTPIATPDGTHAAASIAARVAHTASWTGTEMIVWGGSGALGALGDGARYDPASDSWRAMSSANAPSARSLHTAAWTGSALVVWGGQGASAARLQTGGRYDPIADAWTATSPSPLSARQGHTAVWDPTHAVMIVFGGSPSSLTPDNLGAKYDPATDQWTAIAPAPIAGRQGHVAVWDDAHARMIVWGGTDASFENATDGARYDPATDQWTPIADASVLGFVSSTGCAFAFADGSLWVSGGESGSFGNAAALSGRYDAAADVWAKLPPMGTPRLQHAGAFAGRFVVFGGVDASDTTLGSGEALRVVP